MKYAYEKDEVGQLRQQYPDEPILLVAEPRRLLFVPERVEPMARPGYAHWSVPPRP
jgi:hypothetical protein